MCDAADDRRVERNQEMGCVAASVSQCGSMPHSLCHTHVLSSPLASTLPPVHALRPDLAIASKTSDGVNQVSKSFGAFITRSKPLLAGT